MSNAGANGWQEPRAGGAGIRAAWRLASGSRRAGGGGADQRTRPCAGDAYELSRPGASGAQRGYSLIEVLIALLVGLFLVGGALTLVQNTRRAYGNQAGMAQLQDQERLAMSILNDVIQAAGFFPDPTTYTSAGSLPATGAFAVGQAITGTSGTSDTISVRFMDAISPNNQLINCTGGTNTSTTNTASYINALSITTVGTTQALACTLTTNGTAAAIMPLVNGVQRMQIWYGVKRNFTVDNTNVDTYLMASQMAAADWLNISSVKVRLTFTNPMSAQPGQPATLAMERVIAVMNRSGVKT